MIIVSLFWFPSKIIILRLSSSSTWRLISRLPFWYPRVLATSLPTNHTTPSISTVLSSPNCGWVNIVGASVDVDASGRWRDILDPHLYFCLVPCSFVTHPHSSRRKNAYYIHPPGEMSMFPIHRCWWMRNYQLSHIKKVYKILLTLFEYISQKSISVSRGTLSQLCQRNNSSGCILNQTYYFACNITFIVGFFCFAIVIIPFFNLCELWGSYSFLSLASLIRSTSNNIFST